MKKVYNESELPVYEITIEDDDNSGIRFVSLVDMPAIEVMGMAFTSEQKKYQFKENRDKQIIVGPAMIPNKKIIRKDDDGNKYFVVFSKETINQMVQKFNSNGSNRRINMDHTNRMVDAFIMESWIIEDQYYDKSRIYGFDLPEGTWMISVKIEDEQFWKDEVLDMGRLGFSIEGLMGQKPTEMSMDELIDSLSEDEILELFRPLICIDCGNLEDNCDCE